MNGLPESRITKPTTDPKPEDLAQNGATVDSNENPRITEARKKLQEFLTLDMTPEEAAQALHTVVTATDLIGFSLNVNGVRTIVDRLKKLGFNGPDRFNAFQDSRQAGKYSAEDCLNSFRAHCETLMGKSYSTSPDEAPFDLNKSEIILEFKRA